jgi:hypothetical protein
MTIDDNIYVLKELDLNKTIGKLLIKVQKYDKKINNNNNHNNNLENKIKNYNDNEINDSDSINLEDIFLRSKKDPSKESYLSKHDFEIEKSKYINFDFECSLQSIFKGFVNIFK